MALSFSGCAQIPPLQRHESAKQNRIQIDKKVKKFSARDREYLLRLEDDSASMKCLSWIDTAQAKHVRLELHKSKIASSRIDTILAHRPYTSWIEIFNLPKVGIKTIEKLASIKRSTK